MASPRSPLPTKLPQVYWPEWTYLYWTRKRAQIIQGKWYWFHLLARSGLFHTTQTRRQRSNLPSHKKNWIHQSDLQSDLCSISSDGRSLSSITMKLGIHLRHIYSKLRQTTLFKKQSSLIWARLPLRNSLTV